MHSESSTSPPLSAAATRPAHAPSFGARLLAALSYVGPLFLVPTLVEPKSHWVRWHAAQGFVLFFLEAIALGVAIVVDATIGQIPWVGLLVMLILRVCFLAGFVVLSAIGVVKALAGERNELPFIARYAKQFPGVGPRG